MGAVAIADAAFTSQASPPSGVSLLGSFPACGGFVVDARARRVCWSIGVGVREMMIRPLLRAHRPENVTMVLLAPLGEMSEANENDIVPRAAHLDGCL